MMVLSRFGFDSKITCRRIICCAIDRYVNFHFVRQRLKTYYSETGRSSIDPERLLRIMLIGYLYGVASERKLIEELRMHLAWRWFTGLTFDQEVPHHSTFCRACFKNRFGLKGGTYA
jgi:transposase